MEAKQQREKQLRKLIPPELSLADLSQTDWPRIAKDSQLMGKIDRVVRALPTSHRLILQDSRDLHLPPNSVHLAVTSPPYWTLKEYNDSSGQLGHVADYEVFLSELSKVWSSCFEALVAGGRLVCVVGDVCLSRRKNNGRHTVIPLHASIQESCRRIGFDNLAPIIWSKIANANFEVAGNGGFLGKPYEPNSVIKNDIEYILMFRKPGGYRRPGEANRVLSVIAEADHRKWFRQIWSDIPGESTRHHPAPFPELLAERLVRMFSFVGDTVFDPFMGTATTNVAAAKLGRDSIGCEVDPAYFEYAENRLRSLSTDLLKQVSVDVVKSEAY